MGKARESCTRCQRPRRRPGLCAECAYAERVANDPPTTTPVSRKTMQTLAMLSALGVDLPEIKRRRR